MIINGLGGDDDLTVVGTAVSELIIHTPGAGRDEGKVRVAELLAVNYLRLGLAGSLTIDGAGGAFDQLHVQGTSGDDEFDVAATTGVITQADGGLFGFDNRIPLTTIAVEDLVLNGLEGDDEFTITNPQPLYLTITVNGGGPGASDVLNVNGGGSAIEVNIATQTVTEGGSETLNYSGIEIINVDANADTDAGLETVSIVATDDDDDLTVTVFSATSGKVEIGLDVQQSGQVGPGVVAPLINYTDISAGTSLIVDLAGGEDTLVVIGNALSQTFNVNASGALFGDPPFVPPYAAIPASTVQVDDLNDLSIDGSVTWLNNESVEVFGLEGNDTFNVVAGAIPVFIDGGDPIGVNPGDTIFVVGAMGLVFEGPESDEGGFLTDAGGTVSFDHIENLIVAGDDDCPFLIVGTNGDDDITVIARDESTHPLLVGFTPGIQDFTVSINAGPDVLFIDTPDLYIDALSGDDDIVIRAPAPNDAAWDVYVRVAGGPPSIGEPNDGDRLVLETPGFDNVVFNPTGPDTGNFVIDEGVINGVYDPLGTDSLIEFGPFTFFCPPEPPDTIGFTYISSPGGVELVEYDGELTDSDPGPGVTLTATDNLIINGTLLNDTTTVSPTGVGPGGSGQGSFVSPGSPLFNFRGYDELNVNGGPAPDAPIAVNDLVFALVTGADPTLDVFANDGTTVIASDDDDGPGTSAAIAGAVVPQGGTVYFDVDGFGDGAVGSYELFQVIADPGDAAAESEPNGTFGTADPVTATIMNGTVPNTTGGVDDVDFYSIVAPRRLTDRGHRRSESRWRGRQYQCHPGYSGHQWQHCPGIGRCRRRQRKCCDLGSARRRNLFHSLHGQWLGGHRGRIPLCRPRRRPGRRRGRNRGQRFRRHGRSTGGWPVRHRSDRPGRQRRLLLRFASGVSRRRRGPRRSGCRL